MTKKLPKIISREDAVKILSTPNTNTRVGLRNRVVLQVLYRCGLRVQELCNLTIDDVNLPDGYIYVQQGKGCKDRYVPMDAETVSWCTKWFSQRPQSEYFFCTLTGGQLSQRYIREMCYRTSRKAGVYIRDGRTKKPVNPHALRHTCFTELLEENFSIREVQEMAGHASINTTAIYTHVRPGALAAKIRQRTGIEA